MASNTLLDVTVTLRNKLIASCQAGAGDAFYDPASMARFAQAAVAGGAAAIRANGAADVEAIRTAVPVPIIGIQKATLGDGRIVITPDFESARRLVRAGADMIAVDCTSRAQAHGALDRLRRIRSELGVPVLADIATVEEGVAAARAGADFVLSTLRGYTEETKGVQRFEPAFIAELVRRLSTPVIAEGRISTPDEARKAIRAGAFAVIIGSAITRPHELAHAFAHAIRCETELQSSKLYFLGIDLGGTSTKSGLVSNSGELLLDKAVETPARAG